MQAEHTTIAQLVLWAADHPGWVGFFLGIPIWVYVGFAFRQVLEDMRSN
jgi:hypothetical protein